MRPLDRRSPVRRVLLATVATVGAVAALVQLPSASSSFTATTASTDNALAAASSFCPTPGSRTDAIINDSSVVESAPNANYGSVAPLMVRARTGDARRTFVRPALPAIPSRCQVTSAVLRLSVDTWSPRTLEVLRVGGTWDVGSLTWNNQPAPVGSPTVVSSGPGTLEVDVTAQIVALYGGTNHGLVIRDQTESTASTFSNTFDGIDNGNPPRVTISWG